MTERVFPRVLVVNHAAFGEHWAEPITLTNLFRGWPAERLALAHSDAATSNPGYGLCQRLWRWSVADVPIDRTIRKLVGKRKEQIFGKPAPGVPMGMVASGADREVRWRAVYHGVASAWASLLPVQPPPAFWDWIQEFQPQVIYSMVGSSRLIALVSRVARFCRVPVVPHFMDDWPTTHYRGVLRTIPRKVMLSRLRSVLHRGSLGMAIGPAMAKEYAQRYGMCFEQFMNCVEVPIECPAPPSAAPGHPLKLLFTGGLHLNRWRSLVDIGRALLALREEGITAELAVHTSKADVEQYRPALSAIATIRLGGPLPLDQLRLALQESAILVHVDSFDPAPREYLRLSMSTKLPLCMASGRPILAYGPKELASLSYVQECACGIVVGEQNTSMLVKSLRLLLTSPQDRAALGRRGWQIATSAHDGRSVRERFRLALERAAFGADKATAGS